MRRKVLGRDEANGEGGRMTGQLSKAIAFVLVALAVGGACLAFDGPLPGDVSITRQLQSAFGPRPVWAEWLTDTAKPPYVMLTILAGSGVAWLAARWRGALAVPIAFGLSWVLDKALRAVMFDARPSADLVAVASASTSSGLPSTFGLTFGSIFGVALFVAAKRTQAMAAKVMALALIGAGVAARIVLGGHWTSQMIASTVLGLVAALIAKQASDLAFARFSRSQHGSDVKSRPV